MDERRDRVWQDAELVRSFLDGVRGGIPFAAEQIEAMLRLLAAGGGTIRRALDLGAGDGVLSAALLAQYPAATVTLVDFSEPMLAAARRRFAGQTVPPRTVVADLAASSWRTLVAAEAPFDAVVSGFAIHHLPDARKQALYREIFGLLRPGGVFVNVEHVASPTPRLGAIFDDTMIDALAAFSQRHGHESDRAEVATTYHARPDKDANILAPVDTQCTWLREIGFEDVDCVCKWFELAVFGGRRPEQALVAGTG